MMTFDEFKKAAINEISDGIKGIPHGDKEEYIKKCIPYLDKRYEDSKKTAEILGWDDINVSGIGYGAYMSYPGLEFLGGPTADEMGV